MKQQERLSDIRYLIPLYGDTSIIMSFFNKQFWVDFSRMWKETGPTLNILSKFVLFFINVYAFSIRVFWRFRHSRLTMGWILAFLTIATIFIFNWEERKYTWTPLYSIWFPFHEFFFADTQTTWLSGLIKYYHSEYLWWMGVAFGGLAVIHIILSYLPFNNGRVQRIKRGTPLLWWFSSLFIKRLRPTQNWMLWWVLEAAITFGVGAFMYYTQRDLPFGYFLMIAATCHALLEAYEFFGLSRFMKN